jgi:hypothetical protein
MPQSLNVFTRMAVEALIGIYAMDENIDREYGALQH